MCRCSCSPPPPSPSYRPSEGFDASAAGPGETVYRPSDDTPAPSAASSTPVRMMARLEIEEPEMPFSMPLGVTSLHESDGSLVFNAYRHGPFVALTYALFIVESTRLDELVKRLLVDLHIKASPHRTETHVCPLALLPPTKSEFREDTALRDAKLVTYLMVEDRYRLQAAALQRWALVNAIPREEWTLSLWRALLPFPPMETHVQWGTPAMREDGGYTYTLYNYLAAHILPLGCHVRSARQHVEHKDLVVHNNDDAVWLVMQVCFFLVHATILDLPEEYHTGMLEVFLSQVRVHTGERLALEWVGMPACSSVVRTSLNYWHTTYSNLCELMGQSALAFVLAMRALSTGTELHVDQLPGPEALRAWVPQVTQDILQHAPAIEYHRLQIDSTRSWRLVLPESVTEPKVRGWLMDQHRRQAVLELHACPIAPSQRRLALLRDVHPRDVRQDWKAQGLDVHPESLALEIFDPLHSVYNTVVVATPRFWLAWSLCSSLLTAAAPRDMLAPQAVALGTVVRTVIPALLRFLPPLGKPLGMSIAAALRRALYPNTEARYLNAPLMEVGALASLLYHLDGQALDPRVMEVADEVLRAALCGDVETDITGDDEIVATMVSWIQELPATAHEHDRRLRGLKVLPLRTFKAEQQDRKLHFLPAAHTQALCLRVLASPLKQRLGCFEVLQSCFVFHRRGSHRDTQCAHRSIRLPRFPFPVWGNPEAFDTEPMQHRHEFARDMDNLATVFGADVACVELTRPQCSKVRMAALISALLQGLETTRRAGATQITSSLAVRYRLALVDCNRDAPQPFAVIERRAPEDWIGRPSMAFHNTDVFVFSSNRDSAVFSDWAHSVLSEPRYLCLGAFDRMQRNTDLVLPDRPSEVAAVATLAMEARGTMEEYDPSRPEPGPPLASPASSRDSGRKRHMDYEALRLDRNVSGELGSIRRDLRRVHAQQSEMGPGPMQQELFNVAAELQKLEDILHSAQADGAMQK